MYLSVDLLVDYVARCVVVDVTVTEWLTGGFIDESAFYTLFCYIHTAVQYCMSSSWDLQSKVHSSIPLHSFWDGICSYFILTHIYIPRIHWLIKRNEARGNCWPLKADGWFSLISLPDANLDDVCWDPVDSHTARGCCFTLENSHVIRWSDIGCRNIRNSRTTVAVAYDAHEIRKCRRTDEISGLKAAGEYLKCK